MQLARVVGTVVATVKSPGLDGVKFLVIQPLDARRQPVGRPLVAADAVHMAGPGERVYFVAAREASQALPETFVPVDHAIVGIVDAVEPVGGRRGGRGPAATQGDGPAASAPRGDEPAASAPRGDEPAAGVPGRDEPAAGVADRDDPARPPTDASPAGPGARS